MAVTITQSPQLYTPSDNPVVWVFSSDETAQDNFTFIVELYIGGALDSRHLVFPERDEYAHFNAVERLTARIQKASITQVAVKDAENYNSCYIKVYEKYGTPATLQASATSSTIYPFKCCLSDAEFAAFDYTDYTISGTSKLFLTEFDRDNYDLPFQRSFILQIITNAQSRTLNIDYFTSSGVLTFNETFAISNTIRIAQFNLNSALIADTVDTAYFEVSVKSGGTKVSETITINRMFNDDCQTRSHLIWLNKFGSFDQYTFTHNKTETVEIQRFGYEKQFGAWDGTDYVFNTENTGKQDYLSVMKDGGEISSDYLSEELQHSVVKVYESPYKLLQTATEEYQQITIKNSSYAKQQKRFEELFNEVVNYELSSGRKSQTI